MCISCICLSGPSVFVNFAMQLTPALVKSLVEFAASTSKNRIFAKGADVASFIHDFKQYCKLNRDQALTHAQPVQLQPTIVILLCLPPTLTLCTTFAALSAIHNINSWSHVLTRYIYIGINSCRNTSGSTCCNIKIHALPTTRRSRGTWFGVFDFFLRGAPALLYVQEYFCEFIW